MLVPATWCRLSRDRCGLELSALAVRVYCSSSSRSTGSPFYWDTQDLQHGPCLGGTVPTPSGWKQSQTELVKRRSILNSDVAMILKYIFQTSYTEQLLWYSIKKLLSRVCHRSNLLLVTDGWGISCRQATNHSLNQRWFSSDLFLHMASLVHNELSQRPTWPAKWLQMTF